MKRFLFCALLLFFYTSLEAQLATIDPVVNQFGTLKSSPIRESKTVGSAYLTEDWANVDFFLRKGVGVDSIKSVKANLDLKSNQFEIRTSNDIKVLPAKRVSHARVQHPSLGEATFVNCDEYNFNDTRLEGFAKILYEGEISLVEWYGISIQKPNYNVALDVGSIDERLTKKTVLYFVHGKKLYSVTEANAIKLAGAKKGLVKQFIKQKKIRFKNQLHLVQLVDYYNNL